MWCCVIFGSQRIRGANCFIFFTAMREWLLWVLHSVKQKCFIWITSSDSYHTRLLLELVWDNLDFSVSASVIYCQASGLNPLTPKVKPWVIPRFLTFDSMDRTLKCDHLLESC